MIYICCLDAVDATVYAGKVLKVRLRQQQSEARVVNTLSRVPMNCTGLDLRATPEFWTALTNPAVSTAAGVEIAARRNIAAREAQGITMARTIATAVRLRGGTIEPPYDVPLSLDPDAIEEWLER